MAAFAGGSLPSGWLLCNGSAISRETYSALFRAIGTTYGAGDGSTTFSVPNLVDRFIEGATTTGTVKAAGVPNITGDFSICAFNENVAPINSWSGALYKKGRTSATGWSYLQGQSVSGSGSINGFDASKSNSIYGKSNTVQPPALTMRYAIYTGYVGRYCWFRTF